MLILVLGSSFLVTFLGWEGVGLCSYLLVSFWFERNAAAVAGKKAFVTNRVGDVGFLLAMFLIFASLRQSLDYAAMDAGGAARSRRGTATAIALLLLVGCDRQERADPAAPLAARRDGRPHPGLGAHPRRDDGHRRRVPALPRPPVPRRERRRADRRRVGRRRHRAARGHGRARAARHQTGARVLHRQPARLHVPRRRHRRVHRRRLHGARATRSTRAASSSAPAR